MDNLIAFFKRYDYVFLFILLEIISIVLISKRSDYQSSKLMAFGNGIAGGVYSAVSVVNDYFGLRDENARLATENAQLRARIESSYIKYNDSIFTINDTVYRQSYTYTSARVIKNSWNEVNNYIMIDKGSNRGIHVDQAVISPQGIVGIVVSTTPNFAMVMPVLHSSSRNSVKLERTGTSGTLVWNGGNYRYALLEDIPSTYKLDTSDRIITSGMANNFPEGIAVGTVHKCESDGGSGFYKIEVRLSTEFNKLDYVYVINNTFKEEQEELINRVKQQEEEK